jgi:hypothetical protein
MVLTLRYRKKPKLKKGCLKRHSNSYNLKTIDVKLSDRQLITKKVSNF